MVSMFLTAARNTSTAPKSFPTFNATLLPLTTANFPSSFSRIKPTLMTTLLSTSLLLEEDPGPVGAFLFKHLLGLKNPRRSSAFEAKNCDIGFAEDEAFSCSEVLSLPLSTFAPHLKQNLSPQFTLDPHETQNSAIFSERWSKCNGGKCTTLINQ